MITRARKLCTVADDIIARWSIATCIKVSVFTEQVQGLGPDFCVSSLLHLPTVKLQHDHGKTSFEAPEAKPSSGQTEHTHAFGLVLASVRLEPNKKKDHLFAEFDDIKSRPEEPHAEWGILPGVLSSDEASRSLAGTRFRPRNEPTWWLTMMSTDQ